MSENLYERKKTFISIHFEVFCIFGNQSINKLWNIKEICLHGCPVYSGWGMFVKINGL
ncbi:MAG: hypothetical protein GZ091_09030 [Paludibacter sp.]|nr:hypothetical protein [Paludibacter sp.]